MHDLDALNADPILKDTPIGDLEIVMWGGELAVAVKDRWDPARGSRVIHMVSDQGVLGALYGKRFWEQAHVQAHYDFAAELRRDGFERERADRRGDTERDFHNWIKKEGARDALLGLR